VGSPVKDAKVAVLGFTFKENCPDTRNTKVIDIIRELREYGIDPLVCDPVAEAQEAQNLYGISFVPLEAVTDADALVIAVSHEVFSQMGIQEIDKIFKDISNDQKVVVDVKSVLDRKRIKEAGYRYWSL
jgi:UDP-N-acetyl-D-galactosamine dehydrogenase